MHSIISDEILQRQVHMKTVVKFFSMNVYTNQSQSGVWRAVIGCSISL